MGRSSDRSAAMSDSTDVHLWRAVITQAFADAESENTTGSAPRHRTEARKWLTTDNADLHHVCALADLDPKAVRSLALDLFGDDYRHVELSYRKERYGMRRGRQGYLIRFNGECMTHAEWSRRLGICTSTLSHRLKRGWPLEKALTKSCGPTAPGKHKRQEPISASAKAGGDGSDTPQSI